MRLAAPVYMAEAARRVAPVYMAEEAQRVAAVCTAEEVRRVAAVCMAEMIPARIPEEAPWDLPQAQQRRPRLSRVFPLLFRLSCIERKTLL